MALTGNQLLTGFSNFINDRFDGVATSTGNAGFTTLVDTSTRKWGEDAIRDWYVRYTTAGTNLNLIRRVSGFAASSGTITVVPALAAQTASADTYTLHRYDPVVMFRALDAARYAVSDDLFVIVRNDTITADGLTNEWDIPTAIRHGPFVAVMEDQLEVDTGWNILENPLGDSTTSWTAAAGVVASTYAQNDFDKFVPKYGNSAVKLIYTDAASDGTYTQVVADMDSSFTAAIAAGREMVTGWWVYGEATSNGAVVEIVDDTGTVVTSSAHTGTGWELLTATGVISATNATTLSCRLRIPQTGSNNQVLYVEHYWLTFGSALPNIYDENQAVQVIRDDTIQKFKLPFIPERGKQIRVIGRGTLSALGETAASQATNTMELDAQSAELLYAKAAEILFTGDFLNVQLPQLIVARIQAVGLRAKDLGESKHVPANASRVMGPYN